MKCTAECRWCIVQRQSGRVHIIWVLCYISQTRSDQPASASAVAAAAAAAAAATATSFMNERVQLQLQRKETGGNGLWMASARSNYCNYYEIMQNAYAISGNFTSSPSSFHLWVMGQLVWLDWRPENLKSEHWMLNTEHAENKYNCEFSYWQSVLQYELIWLEFLCRCRWWWRTTNQSHRSSRRLCNCAPTCLPLCSTEYSSISRCRCRCTCTCYESSRIESSRIESNRMESTAIVPRLSNMHIPFFEKRSMPSQ